MDESRLAVQCGAEPRVYGLWWLGLARDIVFEGAKIAVLHAFDRRSADPQGFTWRRGCESAFLEVELADSLGEYVFNGLEAAVAWTF